jgi:hypothetical protein
MKERGMIFNGDMVRALLDGRKTQTRRPIKWRQTRATEIAEREDGSKWPWSEDAENVCDYWHPCPFGAVGDRIWVRETWAILGNEDGCCIDWEEKLCKADERSAARIYRASCEQRPVITACGLFLMMPTGSPTPKTTSTKVHGDHLSTCRAGPAASRWKSPMCAWSD